MAQSRASPQKLVGVGFAAQGFDRSGYYARLPDSLDRRVKFIFEGIEATERIGNLGLINNGAAGEEIDRYDRTLGTPPNTMLLASSEGHTDNMQRVVEEIYFNYPGTDGTQDSGSTWRYLLFYYLGRRWRVFHRLNCVVQKPLT
jgi:N,N-dimethylformamidase beta subunit-like protein